MLRITSVLLMLFICGFFPVAAVVATEVTKTTNPETKLVGWKVSEGNLELELIQRSPDQTRSFFQARGFDTKIANDIATQCVFQTIVRNIGDKSNSANNSTTNNKANKKPITVSLKDWRIKVNDKSGPIKLKEDWDKEWKGTKASKPGQIAFRWATFPTLQTFEPDGDFNFGMISMGPPPATTFDLHIFWKFDGKSKDTWIKNMQCPLDIEI